MAAHFRVASDNAKMGLPEVSLGVIPGYGGTQRLPQLIGKGRAMEMIMTAGMIDADTALKSGLISYKVNPSDLMDKTLSIARKIIKDSSPVSVALTRQMIWGLSQKDSPEYAHIVDSKVIESRGKSKDAAEGVMSFLEKRDAVFENKVSKDMPGFFPFEKDKFEDQ